MKSLRSGQTLPSDTPPDKIVRLFQSETGEIIDAPEPSGVRATLYVLGLFLVSLIVVGAVTRLDRVVTSTAGKIVTTQPTIVLQALDPSVIRAINVRDGEQVKAGDVLARLDPTFATADVDALKLQIASLNAQIGRCEAELAGRPFAPPPSADPAVARYDALQHAYYLQRKQQFDEQIHAYNQQVAQYRATVKKYQADEGLYTDRARLAKEVEQMRAILAKAQVGSRLNLLAAADQKTEMLRDIEFDHNSLIEAQHQLEATMATREAFRQQWLAQTSQELVTARNQRDDAEQKLEKANEHKHLVQMIAPEDAVVLKMAKLSVGSVLNVGDALIYLAPLNSPLEAEVDILTRDIGFIRVGDPVKLKLDAFDFIQHGSAEGTVRWISEGSFATNDDTGQPVAPYYKVRVALTKVELRNVPANFRLIPGMTLVADVHIGTRSLLSYLVEGALRGMNEAMREP
jgi:membrane fusion protein, hemolysin D